MRVSKDGGLSFFEIGDSPEEQAIASEKGYKSYMTMTKDGRDHYDIEATPEQLHIAESKGYMSPEAHKNLAASQTPRESYSKPVSAMQGATSTMTMGFDDEISGAGSAIKAAVQGKSPGDAYRSQRDAYRQAKGTAAADNPISHFAGSMAGGMALPGGAATKTPGLMKAMLSGAGVGAAQGAVQGAGDARSVEEIPKGAAIGAAEGSLYGAAGGAAAKGIQALMRPKAIPRDMPALTPLTEAETSQVAGGAYDNHVAKMINPKLDRPKGDMILHRYVDHDGQKLSHEVYKSGTLVHHSLVDETGKRVAEIKGRVRGMNDRSDPGGDAKPAFVTEWSTSSTKGKGHGKKLYDLALDTHDRLMSDESLSPQGSAKVYEDHFYNSPWVDVDVGTRGTSERHDVKLRDKRNFRKSRGFDSFPLDYEGNLKDINVPGRPAVASGPRDTFIPQPRPPLNPDLRQAVKDSVHYIMDQGADPEIARNYVESRYGVRSLEVREIVEMIAKKRQAIMDEAERLASKNSKARDVPTEEEIKAMLRRKAKGKE